MSKLNILYLADLPTYHVANDVFMLEDNGNKVYVCNVGGKIYDSIEGMPQFKDLVNLYSNRFYPSNPSICFCLKVLHSKLNYKLQYLKKFIKSYDIDIIYASWSTGTMPIIGMLQGKVDVPIVQRFLMHPASLFRFMEYLECWYLKKIVENLDGIIVDSDNMLEYMESNFNIKDMNKIVLMEYLCERYFPTVKNVKLSDSDGGIHLIFLGSVDRNGKHNDVFDTVMKIAEYKIHVHMMRAPHSIEETEFIHFFEKFTSIEIAKGKLADYISQFDGSLVTYNVKNRGIPTRFHNIFPNRFTFALTGCIPIILQKGILKSCEDFINKNNIGFCYQDINELRQKIEDKKYMDKIKKNALNNCNKFGYEHNSHALIHFLDGMCK